ncbi:MAG: carboxypeptidase regulatory-like domain-containing protein, partial [Acidobacteria bacterium]|nr:carboxypeptidase regulatory-like domain-containing protein [Acidobacteriota bacterium]
LSDKELPVSGALVELRPGGSGETFMLRRFRREAEDRREVATDAEGLFSFPALPSGSYDLTVRARGFAPTVV